MKIIKLADIIYIKLIIDKKGKFTAKGVTADGKDAPENPDHKQAIRNFVPSKDVTITAHPPENNPPPETPPPQYIQI